MLLPIDICVLFGLTLLKLWRSSERLLAVKLNKRPVMLCCGTVPVQAFDGIAFFALSAFLSFLPHI